MKTEMVFRGGFAGMSSTAGQMQNREIERWQREGVTKHTVSDGNMFVQQVLK